jgi:hypothetical protein
MTDVKFEEELTHRHSRKLFVPIGMLMTNNLCSESIITALSGKWAMVGIVGLLVLGAAGGGPEKCQVIPPAVMH